MSHRILVVDDEDPIRENLCRFLRLEGHQVEDASDGRVALSKLGQGRFDLVLCDVMMPHCNGFEVLAQMQAHPEWRPIPLVFLSASAEPEKLQEGLAMGARRYITKPFNLLELRRTISELLQPPNASGSPTP
jgi:CheY-like chemotaxis protein